jgi:23S rRNA (uracil1939-C5)-methyltransferase
MEHVPETAERTRRPPFKRGDQVDLTVDRLAYGGRGVGRAQGFVVFVPDSAPGDTVRARLARVKPGYAEAELLHVLRPSPMRTPPPCPHFGPCGGCLWQHIPYPEQVRAKEAIVRESLVHLGGLPDVEVRPILAMDAPWYYRNKMEFTFHPDGELGLHPRGSFDRVIPIDTCLLQSPASNVILGLVRDFARASRLSRYDPRGHTGVLRQLVVREAQAGGEIMVGIITTAAEVPGLEDLASRLRTALPQVTSVVHGVNPGLSDGLPLSQVTVLAGRPYIVEELDGLRFRIGLETFFQTNTRQAARLLERVQHLADLRGGELVFDLYCGVGTFSLALARHAGYVYGVEISPAAVEAARQNAALNGIANVGFSCGDVRASIPELIRTAGRPDVVVLDPPRSGAGKRVIHRVADTGAPRVIYVSCNPTTLAPDLRELAQLGYRIRAVHPLDMFPHTYHVECVALAERSR